MMFRGNYPGARVSPIGAYNPLYTRPPALPVPPVSYPAPPAPPPVAPPIAPIPYPQPYQQLPYQQPYQPAAPYYPQPQQGHFVGDLFHGVGERLQELGQYVLHPFNAQARVMPYHNPFQPRTPGEEAGRWIVNGGLIVGAFFLGRGLLGGSLLGGAARVGSSSSLLTGLGSAVGAIGRGIGAVVTAPFRLLGSLWSGIGSLIGGGAGVGMG